MGNETGGDLGGAHARCHGGFSFTNSVIPSRFLSLRAVSLFPQHFVHDPSADLRDPSSFALFQLFFPALPRISLS